MRNLLALIAFLVVVSMAAVFGAFFTPGWWYEALAKPPLNPPNWIFGPVWSALYLAMAVSGWLIWRAQPDAVRPLALWCAQLLLNAAWSGLFFGLHRPGLALIEILILWGVLGATVIAFWPIHRIAGMLLLPYWAWVTFASYLNAGLWFLNR
ncbi:MAG: tryptophan-rich sensory protein [Myxococcota bacterium]|nr:tryptophan-rich sensory protein [Myxococcota bacterium]